MTNALYLGAVTLLLALGQVLFKHAGVSIRGQSLTEGISILARSPMLYAALAIYGIATILWIYVLSRVPLAQAYPWIAAGIVIVPLLARAFFGERVAPVYWVGVLLVIVGVLITQYAVEST